MAGNTEHTGIATKA